MKTITISSEFFNIRDTLECGQTFRFKPFKKGYLVFSLDKCCYAYNEDNYSIICCDEQDEDYFYNYFDLKRDYSQIFLFALKSRFPIVKESANLGKGIRILNQDIEETAFSFLISQNNNIPKIKSTIEKICNSLGEKRSISFDGETVEYNAFPTLKILSDAPLEVYKTLSLGYRDKFIKKLACDIQNGLSLLSFNNLNTSQLKKELVSIYGVGEKVANCLLLFGYHRGDSFPVDVWIEKVYKENFDGKLTDRKKITEYFLNEFKENSGYIQQYLFYFKRSLEKKDKSVVK